MRPSGAWRRYATSKKSAGTAPGPCPPSAGTLSTRASPAPCTKPRTPRLNGKVERSHRIDAEEFYRLLDGVVIDDAESSTRSCARGGLRQLPRPHGGPGGRAPYERLEQKTTALA
jgi:hypothetical protein